jgi:glycosyltransferase involved in cell wall biosynthesis
MYPSTFNEVSGIFVHEQVKALVEKGMEVQVVSPVPWAPFPLNLLSRKWKTYSEIPAQSVWDGIKVWYPRYLTFPKAWFFASSGQRTYRGIKDVVAKIYQEFPFDLIHAHVALPDGYAGALLGQRLGRPLVVTIHGQDLRHTVERNAACQRAVSYVLNSVLRTILVSHKLKRLATKHFNLRDKLAIVPNGVDPRNVVSRSVELINQQKKGPTLLSVSNLVPTKGIDLNLYALEEMRKDYSAFRYLVIGGGPEEAKLRKLAEELGLEKQVEFLGRQPHHQVMEYMAACDIFTLPSWNEAFGVVYLEAMANGKPVIGCKGEGIEDFVEHGKTGLLVKPRDVDSLVEALDFLLSHPDEAKAMGERAQRLVVEDYTWEKNAEKTIEVYKEALDAS